MPGRRVGARGPRRDELPLAGVQPDDVQLRRVGRCDQRDQRRAGPGQHVRRAVHGRNPQAGGISRRRRRGGAPGGLVGGRHGHRRRGVTAADGLGRPARRRQVPQAVDAADHDPVVVAPARAERGRSARQRHGRAAAEGGLLQRPPGLQALARPRRPRRSRGGKEADPLAVGRQKRLHGALGARQRLRVELVHAADHQLSRAPGAPRVDEKRAVGREGERVRPRRHRGQREGEAPHRGGVGGRREGPEGRRGGGRTEGQTGQGARDARPAPARRRGGFASGRPRRGLQRLFQVADRLARVPHPASRIPFEAAVQHAPEGAGSRRRQLRQIDVAVEHAGQHVRRRLALEQALADQHLVEQDAERPQVGADVDGRARRLLGRHVGRGAHDHAQAGGRGGQGGRLRPVRPGRRLGLGVEGLGQAEVEHLDGPVVAHLDVGRLEVAVHDARLVRGLQGRGDLPRDPHGVVESDGAARD